MAYGVVATTALLSCGLPPATASATVHAAEVFTTAASAGSHIVHRNINWRLLLPLVFAGVLGGVTGAFVLTGFSGSTLKPFITAYLALMGFVILWRSFCPFKPARWGWRWVGPLGLLGGFLDAVGGGGWGPTVTGTLIGGGKGAREAIGTANTAEFFVTAAVSATFIWALLTGRWNELGGIQQHAAALGGLIVGGLLAAPLAGYLVKSVPPQRLTLSVGLVSLLLAGYQTAKLQGFLP